MIWHWSHARQKGWGYPPKKTACQSGLRFQRYKSLKSVTTAGRRAGGPAGRPLILRFLVYISRNSLRASRSLVISSRQSNIIQAHSLGRLLSGGPGGPGGGRYPDQKTNTTTSRPPPTPPPTHSAHRNAKGHNRI